MHDDELMQMKTEILWLREKVDSLQTSLLAAERVADAANNLIEAVKRWNESKV
jgi:hypothetical protein